MNPRRVHELMRRHFPAFSAVDHEWKNIAGTNTPCETLLQELLETHIGEPEVIVEVHRKLGDLLSSSDAPAFVCAHIGGRYPIRIANRAFTSFVIVAQNGVATGWRTNASQGHEK